MTDVYRVESVRLLDAGQLVEVQVQVGKGSSSNLHAEVVELTKLLLLREEDDQVPQLSVDLPAPVDAQACTATLSRKRGVLTVRAPVLQGQPLQQQQHHQEQQQQAPHEQQHQVPQQQEQQQREQQAHASVSAAAAEDGEEDMPALEHPVADDLALLREMYGSDEADIFAGPLHHQAAAGKGEAHQGGPRAAPPPAQPHPAAAAPPPPPPAATAPPAQDGPAPTAAATTGSHAAGKAGAAGRAAGAPAMPPQDCAAAAAGNRAVAEAAALDCSNLAVLLASNSFKAALHNQQGGGSTKKAAKAEKKAVAAMLQSITGSLEQRGYCVCDGYLPMDMVIEARKEIKVMEEHYTPGEIWVGKEADVGATITRRDVRGDKVLWMDAEALAATAFVKDGVQRKCTFRVLSMMAKTIDRLITGELPRLSEQLKHVRTRSDVMLAIYPGGGARFAKHIDNTANDGRRLTLLCYLNPNWRTSLGGQLRLFPPGADPVDVYPQAGRLAMFLSKVVPHEVMPTHAPRHSFTLWYYDAIERAEAVAAARVAAGGAAAPEAQLAARDLIRDILAGDSGATGSLPADEEGVAALQRRVRSMAAPALAIVASITGLASAQALKDSVEAMAPSDMLQLREALAHMGLGEGDAHTPAPASDAT